MPPLLEVIQLSLDPVTIVGGGLGIIVTILGYFLREHYEKVKALGEQQNELEKKFMVQAEGYKSLSERLAVLQTGINEQFRRIDETLREIRDDIREDRRK